MLFGLKKFVSFWLMPLPACVTLLLIGLWLLRSPRRAWLGRTLLITGTVLLMLFANNFVSKWLARPLENRFPPIPELTAGVTPPQDLAACRFVVVLGGGNGHSPGQSATNQLSPGALSRLVEGVRVLRVLPAARLIVSGPGSGERPTHAAMLAAAAESLGVDRTRIVLIDQGHDTEDEARLVRQQVGDAPIALVTSAWHLPRAMTLFRHAGVTALPCPADYRAHTNDAFIWTHLLWDERALERSAAAVRERIGRLWIWLRGKG